MDRREFTVESIMALLAGVTITILGCDEDDPPTSPSNQGATGVIANNHGHAATVTSAQIIAGQAVRLDIRGSADHSHTVDLTNDDIVRLASRQRVERDSTLQNGHTHRVTFN